jgi:chromosome segregation ATPase
VVKLKFLLSRHNDVLRKYPRSETRCAILQTQLSRKAKEIDSLSSRNNQLQTQCDKLRTQPESSEYLINQLSYDRCSLERRVDGQEETIEMLKMSRDDAWSQCSAFIDQYLNIMSLASALGKEICDKERLWVARQHMWERACSEHQAHLGHLKQEMHDCCRYSNGQHQVADQYNSCNTQCNENSSSTYSSSVPSLSSSLASSSMQLSPLSSHDSNYEPEPGPVIVVDDKARID